MTNTIKPDAAIKRIHAWLAESWAHKATITELMERFRIGKACASYAIDRLRTMEMVKDVGKVAILGQGKPPTIWAATGKDFPPPKPRKPRKKRVHKPKILRQVDDEDDHRPLSRVPASAIVQQAIASRHFLDIAWGGPRIPGSEA